MLAIRLQAFDFIRAFENADHLDALGIEWDHVQARRRWCSRHMDRDRARVPRDKFAVEQQRDSFEWQKFDLDARL